MPTPITARPSMDAGVLPPFDASAPPPPTTAPSAATAAPTAPTAPTQPRASAPATDAFVSMDVNDNTCNHDRLRILLSRQRGEVSIAPVVSTAGRPTQTVAAFQASETRNTVRELVAGMAVPTTTDAAVHGFLHYLPHLLRRLAPSSSLATFAQGATGAALLKLTMAYGAGRLLAHTFDHLGDIREHHAAQLGELQAAWTAYQSNRNAQTEAAFAQRLDAVAAGMLAVRDPAQLNSPATIERMERDGYFALGLRLGTGIER